MLKYWVEHYDGFVIFLNQNTEASETRGVETVYEPSVTGEQIIDHMIRLESMGYKKQPSEGLEENVIEYVERMKK